MVKPIYVLQDPSRGIGPGNPVKYVAVQPPSKGEKAWYCVDNAGKFSRSTQLRIGGMGVEKALQLTGYVPESQTSEHAQAVDNLRTQIRVRRGRELVEQALANRAVAIQQELGGRQVWVVPFDAAKPAKRYEVEHDIGSRCRSINLLKGITGASFRVSEVLGKQGSFFDDIELLDAWVVEAEEGSINPPPLPRVSEYGGLVEHAAYVLCSAGLTTLSNPCTLCIEEDPPYEPMPRGCIVLDLPADGAQLYVGIDAGDELLCQVYAGGRVVAEHKGLEPFTGSLNLGAAVGSVAAALVAYREMQEAAPKVKKPRPQAKAA